MEKTYEDIEQEFWIPEKENDAVEGIYLSSQSEVGENKAMVYNLEKDGKITSVWGSKVLDQKMKLCRFGEDIKIIYLGIKKGDKRDYKDFKIQKAKEE